MTCNLHEVRVRQDVAGPGGAQLFKGQGVGVPTGVDLADVPLCQVHRVLVVVELPSADPMDRAEKHVEGVLVEQGTHVVHLPSVVVDLEPELDGEPLSLGLFDQRHIVIEIAPGVVVEVVRHRPLQRR